MQLVFQWAAWLMSVASGSVVNHPSDRVASTNRARGGSRSARLLGSSLLFGAFGQMEQVTGSSFSLWLRTLA